MLLTACRPARREVVVLFDNDVHCAVQTYAKMASAKDSLLVRTPYVAVISAGDFVQGDAVGSLSKGEYIAEIMNAVPYDAVTVGNHEFDYGMERLRKLVADLSAEVVCCNFTGTDGKTLCPAWTMRRYGPLRVAFVGAATPTSYTSSTPSFFQDSLGNMLYDFHADDSFALIQRAVDEARGKGADYVFVLSHLGDDTAVDASPDMIRATHGIDAVFDGHAHHFLDMRIPNLDGDSVLLLSTGARGQYIGVLSVMPDGQLVHSFLTSDKLPSAPRVQRCIDGVEERLRQQIGKVVGYTEITLTDKDAEGNRLVRNAETNLSCFVADAMREVSGAQIGAIHGGSLRASVPAGDITLGTLITLLPFNNSMALVRMTGQQLLDAAEVAVARWPLENGDFHIFSGLRYTINPQAASSVLWDENFLFAGVGGTRRIVSMEVQDRKDGSWSPVDPEAVYTVGGLNYTLLNCGSSGMFRYAEPLPCPEIPDTEILVRYLHFLGDTVRASDYPQPSLAPRFSVRSLVL